MAKIPCIAAAMLGDLECGAIMKHIDRDSRRAIVVDWIWTDPFMALAVTADQETFPEFKTAKEACSQYGIDEAYSLTVIKDFSNWIVVQNGGGGELLVE